jgi:hypothetical protein
MIEKFLQCESCRAPSFQPVDDGRAAVHQPVKSTNVFRRLPVLHGFDEGLGKFGLTHGLELAVLCAVAHHGVLPYNFALFINVHVLFLRVKCLLS